jgi:hypothetical protein
VPPHRIDQRGNSWDKSLVGKRIKRQLHFFLCNSQMRICSSLDKIQVSRKRPKFSPATSCIQFAALACMYSGSIGVLTLMRGRLAGQNSIR